jgi:hypothetical protein
MNLGNIPQDMPVHQLGDIVGRVNGHAAELVPADERDSDPDASVDFLKLLDPTGWHNLVAFWPGGGPEGRTFEPGSWDTIQRWVAGRTGKANLYYTGNEPKPGAPHKKLEKSDIGSIRCLYADRDPAGGIPVAEGRAEIERWLAHLEGSAIAPSIIVDSGGGYQILWALSEKLPAEQHQKWAEALGRGLADIAGGDRVQSIDHLLRLPGTLNIPDEKKRAKGRTARMARLTAATERRYDRGGFGSVALVTGKEGAGSAKVQAVADEIDIAAIEACVSYADLPSELRERFEASTVFQSKLWTGGKNPDGGGDLSGSGQIASLAAALAAAGLETAQDFGHLVHVWPHAEGSKEYERDRLRCIARTWANVGIPNLRSRWFDESKPEPESVFPPEPPFQGPRRKSITWIDPAEWEGKDVPAREWEVEGWIPRKEVTLLYGDGGIGKTLLMHQYAVAAAAGVSWLGQRTRPARVLGFFCEDSEEELQRRHVDILRALGLGFGSTSGRLRLSCRRFMDNLLALYDRGTGEMSRQAIWTQLRDDAREFGADVVILDTLADIYAGEEQNRAQVTAFVKSCLGRLARDIGGSVITLGHPSQAGQKNRTGTSGSTAWSNAVRSRLYLRYPENVTAGNIRELEGMKLNYGPKGSKLKLRWNRGAFDVVAGNVPAMAGAGQPIPSLNDAAEDAVLSALLECQGVQMSEAPNSTYFAPRILKRRAPDRLASLTEDEVRSALDRMSAKNLIRFGEVGRNASRHAVKGYTVLTDNLSARAPSPFN